MNKDTEDNNNDIPFDGPYLSSFDRLKEANERLKEAEKLKEEAQKLRTNKARALDKKYQEMESKTGKPYDNIPTAEELLDITEGLTVNQKRFLEEYLKTNGNVAKAIKNCGLNESNHPKYTKLLKTPAARRYMSIIKNEGFKLAKLTVQEIITEARDVIAKAKADGDYKAANEAIKFLGNYLGMQVDRSEKTIKNTTLNSGDKPDEVKKDLKALTDIVNKVNSGGVKVVKIE